MTRTINARFAGTCSCSRQFAQGARITLDEHRRVISCYDCTTALNNHANTKDTTTMPRKTNKTSAETSPRLDRQAFEAAIEEIYEQLAEIQAAFETSRARRKRCQMIRQYITTALAVIALGFLFFALWIVTP
jgi:leucyl-tRNA synthetase